MSENYEAAQSGEMPEDLREQVTGLGLEYRLLTQFTSFVAVEETTVTDGGRPRRIDVPVETPEGVASRGVTADNSASVVVANAEPTGTVGPVVGVAGGTGGGGAPTGVADEAPAPPAPVPTPMPRPVISGGVLNGKVISKPRPTHPLIGTGGNAHGTVAVQVVVDEQGRVVSASAVSGHPLLQQAAVAAARQARFSPTLLSGQPVKVSGVITYNFGPGGAADVPEGDPADPAAEEERWREFLKRLHPHVASVVERLREGKETPGAAEASFVRDGRAELRIRLASKSPGVLAQLKALGFELVLDVKSSGLVVGRLPLEKLKALAEIEAVLYVSPQTD
jgi:TonB family protein